ncbi:dihydroneopterin aldolase [uncultured Phocaeicola sp.]|uniref:dihydroneopterin aldolase n=1 Tax=uncultured Phocaeicola sp. TaxID=990718 RepID=UPI0025FAFF08|nr:dihydroneopterin aldolase [uncultured Phocaeicola sp.]
MKSEAMYIRLEGLTFYARHGVLPQETEVGAEFTVDLCLVTDFSYAAETDELEGTLNYAEVFERVKAEMNIPSKLLEHVAYRIARRLLHDFPALTEVQIGVYKQNPPMGADVRRVGVEAVFGR